MVDVLWNVSRTNQKIEEAELNVVSAPGLFFIIFVWFQKKIQVCKTSTQNVLVCIVTQEVAVCKSKSYSRSDK